MSDQNLIGSCSGTGDWPTDFFNTTIENRYNAVFVSFYKEWFVDGREFGYTSFSNFSDLSDCVILLEIN